MLAFGSTASVARGARIAKLISFIQGGTQPKGGCRMRTMQTVAAAALLLLCGQPRAFAATVVVDPVLIDGAGPFVSRPVVAVGIPGYTIAQSFEAVTRSMRFGFRLVDYDITNGIPDDAGKLVTYRLYEGENVYKRLIARRYVALPAHVSTDPFRANLGDLGFVEADFSQVKLKQGAQYTMRISMSLPFNDSPPNVWLSWANPYLGGRLYFPPGIDRSHPDYDYFYGRDWSNEDLFFRLSSVERTVQQLLVDLRKWIVQSPAIGIGDRIPLLRELNATLSDPNTPEYQSTACGHLGAMLVYVDSHSNHFDNATAVQLFDRIDGVRTTVPCP